MVVLKRISGALASDVVPLCKVNMGNPYQSRKKGRLHSGWGRPTPFFRLHKPGGRDDALQMRSLRGHFDLAAELSCVASQHDS